MQSRWLQGPGCSHGNYREPTLLRPRSRPQSALARLDACARSGPPRRPDNLTDEQTKTNRWGSRPVDQASVSEVRTEGSARALTLALALSTRSGPAEAALSCGLDRKWIPWKPDGDAGVRHWERTGKNNQTRERVLMRENACSVSSFICVCVLVCMCVCVCVSPCVCVCVCVLRCEGCNDDGSEVKAACRQLCSM